ncbi:MAG: hypothetical protein BroJett013_01890 [Alphaproteobacteria bacterium]|nr:MAG: hypothetical protein BroJett013_01890 [Alphaproteobacteria bacterium]
MRLHDRRRENRAAPPPHLPTAMRQLRMYVIDACGAGAQAFANRTRALAALAQAVDEPEAAETLAALAKTAAHGGDRDVRGLLYQGLERAHAALRTAH